MHFGTYYEFSRTIFEIKNILLIEFWPGLANVLGLSEINQGFEKVSKDRQILPLL